MTFQFKEFYQVLDSIFTKKRIDFELDESNFNMFLICRYISFYNPELCVYVNALANKNGLLDVMNYQSCYDYLFNTIPKMKKKFIKYVKKAKTQTIEDKNISDEEITQCADYYEISKREVMFDIQQLKELKFI